MKNFIKYLAVGMAVLCTGPVQAVPVKHRPNILFIVFDDWSRAHAGAYGCDWVKTPNFDRLAREGVLFQNAFTSNPKCAPSRASMLTVRNSCQLKEGVSHWGIFPSGFETYPELLYRAGYVAGCTDKNWATADVKATVRIQDAKR